MHQNCLGEARPRIWHVGPKRVVSDRFKDAPKGGVYRSIVVVVTGVRAISDFMRAYSSRAISPRA